MPKINLDFCRLADFIQHDSPLFGMITKLWQLNARTQYRVLSTLEKWVILTAGVRKFLTIYFSILPI